MSCLVSNGLGGSCEYLMGGLRKAWIANWSSAYTAITDSNSDGVYDTISGATFYQIEFENNTAFYNAEMQVGGGGNKYFNQTFTFNYGKQDQSTIDYFETLGLGKFIVIGENRNGVKHIVGLENGLQATALSFGSGTAEGDFGGFVYTATAPAKKLPDVFHSGSTIPTA